MIENEKYLGIEIGGTKLQLAVGDASGVIEKSIRFTIDPTAGAAAIQGQVIDGLEQVTSNSNIVAVGIGFGGPVNWKTGLVQLSHQVSGWSNFNIAKWLQQLTKKLAVVDNDANVAALAESVHGCGKGHERVFYITIGSGIGGGMVIDGEIYHGKMPGEVEVGHLRMNKEGITLESTCSGWAVNKRIKSYIQQQPQSLLAKIAADSLAPESTFLKPALEQNDGAAKKIILEVADDLSFALSHVVHLFHPDVIVIGGGLSLLKEHLRVPIEERLPAYIMKAFLPIPSIKIAALGENVVPLGALELAKKHLLKVKNKEFPIKL